MMGMEIGKGFKAMAKVHEFDSTGDAYDACQCYDEIKDGDLLLIKSERVVGIAGTWPVAVTAKNGKLHTPAKDYSLVACLMSASAAEFAAMDDAIALANKHGWEVRS